ncbi:MAG: acyl-CoA dehydrogenase [Acidobacteria bacterium]|nr:MAG: acyl-CoA dehydrogenase [Acidobacteriota bacterium]REK11347.1 MAG: acyl-CoA dehydrogenase [Acidobacteriota bacterium]
MDFSDTSEIAAFRGEARAWLSANCRRKVGDGPRRWPLIYEPEHLADAKAWQAAKCDAGWAGLHWPEEYGGRGLSRLHSIVFSQEEEEFDTPAELFHIGINICAPTLMAYGSDEVKRRHLRPLLRGDEIWCQLFSEPGAGSDLAGIRTRAVRDGDEWSVTGQKIWNSFAHLADHAILVTRHDPGLAKHKGMTYFFVDMKDAGVEVRRIGQIGGRGNFCEVFLTGARIPDAHRLGEVGEGWQVALTTLLNERLGGGRDRIPDFEDLWQAVGQCELEEGRALDDAGVRERLADWYVQTQGVRLLRARMMTALARGDQPGPEASVGKLVVTNKMQELSSAGLDLLEQCGVLAGDPRGEVFLRGFFDAPGTRIAGGTDEILRNILAERVLGLPGDVRVDRGKPFSEIPNG